MSSCFPARAFPNSFVLAECGSLRSGCLLASIALTNSLTTAVWALHQSHQKNLIRCRCLGCATLRDFKQVMVGSRNLHFNKAPRWSATSGLLFCECFFEGIGRIKSKCHGITCMALQLFLSIVLAVSLVTFL